MLPKIQLQNLYKYFFYFFLFFLPFQTRKVFLTPYSFYTGDFTEYGNVFLYFSDILFVLALISLCLFNGGLIKNRLIDLESKSDNHQDRGIFVVLLGFVLCVFLSVFCSEQYFVLSLFKFCKIFEMLLLMFFVYITFGKERFFITSLFIVSLSGFFQSLLAIYQFLYQKSIFTLPLLHKITGETILSPAFSGIAKIVFERERMIRAYGTFPHPNILGGFLVFSIFITVYLYYEHRNDYLSSKYQLGNVKIQRNVISFFWLFMFLSQFLALLLSFSRSAWLGFAIGIFIFAFIYFKYSKIVSRETIASVYLVKHLRTHKELYLSILFILVLAISNMNLVFGRIMQDVSLAENTNVLFLPHNEVFDDRIFFNNVSRETILHNPLFGSGPGTSIFQIKDYLYELNTNVVLESWQYQPTHNIYFLCASEIGVIGSLLLFYATLKTIVYRIKKIVSRETIYKNKILKLYMISVLIVFMIIGMFDHYFWTSQQGAMMFWLTFGMIIV